MEIRDEKCIWCGDIVSLVERERIINDWSESCWSEADGPKTSTVNSGKVYLTHGLSVRQTRVLSAQIINELLMVDKQVALQSAALCH